MSDNRLFVSGHDAVPLGKGASCSSEHFDLSPGSRNIKYIKMNKYWMSAFKFPLTKVSTVSSFTVTVITVPLILYSLLMPGGTKRTVAKCFALKNSLGACICFTHLATISDSWVASVQNI